MVINTEQHETIPKGIITMKSTLELRTRNEAAQANNQGPVNTNSCDMVAGAEENRATSSKTGHIGRIVAGTLISGLVGAIAAVAGPFAGAREHIITGSVLVIFSIAWTMLAVLSERWTNQPQRWAIAPAVFMALTGTVILVLAPTGNQLGWIWPPMVVALTVSIHSFSTGTAKPGPRVAGVPGLRGLDRVRCRWELRDLPRAS